ncbi:MAG TPA: hypothetical protein VKB93_21615 [Thermoanaerobaculia bacterium]|nr:hypothetical protein [Thermoanaerobaculia bacterium]
MRNATLTVLLLTSLTLAAQPSGPPPPRGPEFLLPPDFARLVKLTPDQTQKLDKLKPQAEEIARLEREAMKAAREVRAASSGDTILAAGNRFATLRDQLLRKQIALLAAQRAILTQAQWSALQEEREAHRPPPPR